MDTYDHKSKNGQDNVNGKVKGWVGKSKVAVKKSEVATSPM
jgi:hypothetical protein